MTIGRDYIGIGVVFACHDGEGRFLFAKRGKGARDGHGLWEIPAGGLECGETLKEGLHREIWEEFKARPRKTEFMGHKEVLHRNEDGSLRKHWIAFEFLVRLNPADVSIGEPDKCEAIEWRSLDNLPGELHDGTEGTIANIIEYQKSL